MSKSVSLFDTLDYRAYLDQRLPTQGEGRGARARLAEALRVQSAFVSRVMKGDADFSLEHAVAINEFLGHSETEGEYFVLLVEFARAGTKATKAHFQKQIQKIRETHQALSDRLKIQEGGISEADQMTYYSSWHYAAIHVLLLVPSIRTAQAIATHLGFSVRKTSEALEFLIKAGMARREGNEYFATESWIHLRGDSPLIGRHHSNWRLRAMQKFDDKTPDDVFFSGPIAISQADSAFIRERLVQLMKELEPVIRKSPEEAVFCLNFDFFRV